MENRTSQYVNGGDQASSRSENTLPGPVEAALEEVYKKHNVGPINDETRRRLSLVSEELASDTLTKILKSHHVVSLDGFIKYFLDQDTNGSPRLSSQSPAVRRRLRGDERAEEKEEMKNKMLKLINIYYDALDAPKQGGKVDLPDELKYDIFPHYLERDNSFKSTSILGVIYDFVESHTSEKHRSSSEISKLSCFKDEPVSDFHMEKYGRWYDNYRKEMSEALRNKDGSASEVVQRYKQDFYDAAGFEDSKKSLEELYPQALALYNIVYNHAIKWNNVRNCGFVWKVAGPVLCRFYLEKTQGKSLLCSITMLKELWG